MAVEATLFPISFGKPAHASGASVARANPFFAMLNASLLLILNAAGTQAFSMKVDLGGVLSSTLYPDCVEAVE